MHSTLLVPLSGLYRLALMLRKHYSRLFSPPQSLGRPTIKVGNITTGGTGKTPFVIYLARLLGRHKLQPVVLTRGYGRRSSGALKVSDSTGPGIPLRLSGDEARLIAEQVHSPVYVCEDRRAGARLALREHPQATFILDDAYQQIGIRAELNLLLIDATNPFENGRLLPAGRLREPLGEISRADGIIVTRADHPFNQDWLVETLKRYNRAAPLFFSYNDVVGLQELTSGTWFDTSAFRGRKVVALSGIASPRLFELELAHQQLLVQRRLDFPDHHAYSQAELDRALREANGQDAALVVTTEKDAIKLKELAIPPGQVYALGIETRVDEEENFVSFLNMFIDL